MNESTSPKIAFVGTGRMATALAKGLVAGDFTTPDAIAGFDVVPAAREQFSHLVGGRNCESISALIPDADVVVLAVKPHQVRGVLKEIHRELQRESWINPLIVSIAAGVPLAVLADELGPKRRIVRVMPNTPSLVGAGAAAFAVGGATTEADASLVRQFLQTVGVAHQVPETLLDAVTGLSGSGPAYVYQIIEALSDGGVNVGLPRDVATQLAAQTVLGAAKMVLETGEHPGALKDAVTSPGGTTIAGLHALEQGGLRGVLMNAVSAATQKARDLGK